MAKKSVVLSRKAVAVTGGLIAYLVPKLAQDARLPDFSTILDGVNSSNWRRRRAFLADDIASAMQGRLAQDASIAGLPNMLMAFDDVEPGGSGGTSPSEGGSATEPDSSIPPFTKAQVDSKTGRDKRTGRDQECPPGKTPRPGEDQEEEEEEGGMPPQFRRPPAPPQQQFGGEDEDNVGEQDGQIVSKAAMDAAIAAAVRSTAQKVEARVINRMRAIDKAREECRPYVGDLNLAFDSATDVYRAALDHLRVRIEDDVPDSALAAILRAQPLPQARTARSSRQEARVAMDSATSKSYDEMFPGASLIGNLGAARAH